MSRNEMESRVTIFHLFDLGGILVPRSDDRNEMAVENVK
jgi:hypothetical protein